MHTTSTSAGTDSSTLSTQDYWDTVWEASKSLPSPINPRDNSLRNHMNLLLDHRIRAALAGIKTEGLRLLEVGCANSRWLPYFALEHGFKVTGIDYSDTGCKSCRQILRNAHIEGDIVNTDFSTPPASLIDAFDIVISYGFVEHFKDTSSCIRSLSSFLKTDGLLITIIPNMAGLNGLIQKTTNRSVYDIHVPLKPTTLAFAHRAAEMTVTESSFVGSTNFGVVNLNGLNTHALSYKLSTFFIFFLSRISVCAWLWEKRFGFLPRSLWFSPYVFCSAIKRH